MKLFSIYSLCQMIACLVLAVFLSGCGLVSQNSNPFQELIIETDKETYSKQENELILASILNESAESVFITVPRHVTLNKKVDGKWKNVGTWYLTVTTVPHLAEIAPGEGFSGIPELYSDNTIIEDSGLYRFQFGIYSSSFDMVEGETGSKYILPLKYRTSNTFYISD